MQERVRAISYLLPESFILQKGNMKGICLLCGVETEVGYPVEFSSTFSAFSSLAYGDVFCPFCFSFFRNQDFRRRSWIITKEQVEFAKRDRILEFLLFDDKPLPFVVYITSTGQKQGWLQGFRYVNFSRQRFFIHTDFAGCVLADYEELKGIHHLLEILREHKVSKTELETGDFSMHTYKKSIEQNFESELRQAKNYVKHPIWEVMVYVC